MLKKIIENYKNNKIIKELKKDPLYLVVKTASIKASEHHFNNLKNPKNDSKLVKTTLDLLETRKKNSITKILVPIATADNSFIKFRQMLAESIISTAYYEVLLKSSPYFGYQGVSGTLNKHLVKIINEDVKIKQLIHGSYPKLPDLKKYENANEFLKILYDSQYWFFITLDGVRKLFFKDHPVNLKNDWVKTAFHAACVGAEWHYYQLLNIKPKDINYYHLPPIYGSILNMIYNGVKYPDFQFKEDWKDFIAKGILKIPVFN